MGSRGFTGINAVATISVTDGEYTIDCRAFASTSGTGSNGQTVAVRQPSSSLFSTMTTTILSIGVVLMISASVGF